MFRKFMTFISPKILSFILPYLKRKEMSKGILHHIQSIMDEVTNKYNFIKLVKLDEGLLSTFTVEFNVYGDKYLCLEISMDDKFNNYNILFRETNIIHLSELKEIIDIVYELLEHTQNKQLIISAFMLKRTQTI